MRTDGAINDRQNDAIFRQKIYTLPRMVSKNKTLNIEVFVATQVSHRQDELTNSNQSPIHYRTLNGCFSLCHAVSLAAFPKVKR